MAKARQTPKTTKTKAEKTTLEATQTCEQKQIHQARSPAEREILRLLSRLAEGGWLKRDHLTADEDTFALLSSKNGITLHVATVRAEPVVNLLSDGALCERKDGSVWLSTAGIAKLKRLRGSDPQEQHQEREWAVVLDENHTPRQVRRNIDESPLSRLGRLRDAGGQPWIAPEHIAAGEKLRQDFTVAGLSPHITMRWQPVASRSEGYRDGVEGLSITRLAARERLNKALSSVGATLADLLLDSCCHLKGLEQIERERSWPPRSAKLALRCALESLNRHYEEQMDHRFTRKERSAHVWQSPHGQANSQAWIK